MSKCGNKKCIKPGDRRCTGCDDVFYCSDECRRIDWEDGHNRVCVGVLRVMLSVQKFDSGRLKITQGLIKRRKALTTKEEKVLFEGIEWMVRGIQIWGIEVEASDVKGRIGYENSEIYIEIPKRNPNVTWEDYWAMRTSRYKLKKLLKKFKYIRQTSELPAPPLPVQPPSPPLPKEILDAGIIARAQEAMTNNQAHPASIDMTNDEEEEEKEEEEKSSPTKGECILPPVGTYIFLSHIVKRHPVSGSGCILYCLPLGWFPRNKFIGKVVSSNKKNEFVIELFRIAKVFDYERSTPTTWYESYTLGESIKMGVPLTFRVGGEGIEAINFSRDRVNNLQLAGLEPKRGVTENPTAHRMLFEGKYWDGKLFDPCPLNAIE